MKGGRLAVMPAGRWKGTPFAAIPADALRGLLEFYRGSVDTPAGVRLYDRLLDEWIARREAQPWRRRRRSQRRAKPPRPSEGKGPVGQA